MNQLICLRHPTLDARTTPELSCKTCCTIFVNAIRERRQQQPDEAEEWTKAQQRVAVNDLIKPSLK